MEMNNVENRMVLDDQWPEEVVDDNCNKESDIEDIRRYVENDNNSSFVDYLYDDHQEVLNELVGLALSSPSNASVAQHRLPRIGDIIDGLLDDYCEIEVENGDD